MPAESAGELWRVLKERFLSFGTTEHLFALCNLPGIEFMPGIKDLADQQLYKVSRESHYGSLDELFRVTVFWGLIRAQWDKMVRVVAELKTHNAPPEVVVQRLASAGSADCLSKALTGNGSVQTIYILRYIQEDDLRRSVRLQLNRREHRHIRPSGSSSIVASFVTATSTKS